MNFYMNAIEYDKEMCEMNMNMLTSNQWNPPDANKIEEALSESQQKHVAKKKNSTPGLPIFK